MELQYLIKLHAHLINKLTAIQTWSAFDIENRQLIIKEIEWVRQTIKRHFNDKTT